MTITNVNNQCLWSVLWSHIVKFVHEVVAVPKAMLKLDLRGKLGFVTNEDSNLTFLSQILN